MYKIIEDENMVEIIPSKIKRTLWERLFSWPWNPLKDLKDVELRIPCLTYIKEKNNVVCHPKMAEILRKHFPETYQ